MPKAVLTDFTEKQNIFWFSGASLLAIICLLAALLLDVYALAALPFLAVAAFLCLVKPLWVLYLMMLVMPFSMEWEWNGFGTDLPSEPLALVLSGLAVLSLFLQEKSYRKNGFFFHPLTLILLLHLLWIIVILPFSVDFIVSLKYFLAKTWYLLGFFVASWWLLNIPQKAKNALIIFTVSTLAGVAYIVLEHGLLGFTFDTINTACNPLYRNHVTYGVFLAMILPVLVYFRNASPKDSLLRLATDAGLVLLLSAILLTYTRGAWLAVPAMVAAYVALVKKWFRFLLPLGLLAASIFFIYMGTDRHYLNYAPDYENTIYHDDLSDHLSATFDGEDMSTMERFHRWIAAFRMMDDYAVTGTGPGNFVSLYKPYTVTDFETYISENEERSTVHNYFIFMMVEQGYPGLIIAIVLSFLPFLWAERQYARLKNKDYQHMYAALMLAGIAFWLNNLFSDLLEANKVAPFWLMSLALMMRIEQWDREKNADAKVD